MTEAISNAVLSLEAGLDSEQLSVFHHESAKPGAVLIYSGPGTGKTTVLARRLARRILEGLPAREILGLTLTARAAQELADRVLDMLCRAYYGTTRSGVRDILGDPGADPVWREAAQWVDRTARQLRITTYHSLAFSILRDRVGARTNIELAGLPPEITIADRGIQERLARIILGSDIFELERIIARLIPETMESVSAEPVEHAEVNALLEEARLAKARLIPLDAVLCDRKNLYFFLKAWNERFRPRGILDFDDVVLVASDLLEAHADLRGHYRRRATEVVVDEFQDTTPAQLRLLKLVAGDEPNLIASGDVHQAVMTRMGTDPTLLGLFTEIFPGGRTINFRINYRMTSQIFSAGRAVLDGGVQEPASFHSPSGARVQCCRFISGEDEINYIAAEARRLREENTIGSYDEIAVLVRRFRDLEPIAEQLVALGVPATVLGNKGFWYLQEIRAARASIILAAMACGLKPPAALTKRVEKDGASLPREAIEALARSLAPDSTLLDAVNRIFVAAGYPSELTSDDPKTFRIRRNVDHLRRIIERRLESGEQEARWPQGAPGLEATLQAAVEEAESGPADREAVRVLSIHSAKGLEWDAVFLPMLEEGIFPSDAWTASHLDEQARYFILDEERRLFYIASTRARTRLYLLHAWKRRVKEEEIYLPASRFLNNLPIAACETADAIADLELTQKVRLRARRVWDWLSQEKQ